MAQHTNIVLPQLQYTRADYAALRAFCQGITLATIADMYYDEDSPQLADGLECFLLAMRDTMIDRASAHNPNLAETLRTMRSTGRFSATAMKILVDAAEMPAPVPAPTDPLGHWFRRRTANALRDVAITTLGQLVAYLNRRGHTWWHGVPRIGHGRAQVINQWLTRHEKHLGQINLTDYAASPTGEIVVLAGGKIAPLERAALPHLLDGSTGINRASRFCMIRASNDADAIRFYLSRHIEEADTVRAYQRELERLLIWAVAKRGVALSSLMVDDCELYKRFLADPDPDFVGMRQPRKSPRWRPFTGPLSPGSQVQAITILRAAFDYWVRVRYLESNPWHAIVMPKAIQRISKVQTGKALPRASWDQVIEALNSRCQVPENVQDRVARAMMLIMGDSGLRREELVTTLRSALKPGVHANLWVCSVIGKGNKERAVALSPRAIEALRAHWVDRGLDFDAENGAAQHLVGPVASASTRRARAKAEAGLGGYHPDSVTRVLDAVYARLSADGVPVPPIKWSAHGFRHTFGTLAVAGEMPLDVVQKLMGHASLDTTTMYVDTEQARLEQQSAKFFSGRKQSR